MFVFCCAALRSRSFWHSTRRKSDPPRVSPPGSLTAPATLPPRHCTPPFLLVAEFAEAHTRLTLHFFDLEPLCLRDWTSKPRWTYVQALSIDGS